MYRPFLRGTFVLYKRKAMYTERIRINMIKGAVIILMFVTFNIQSCSAGI